MPTKTIALILSFLSFFAFWNPRAQPNSIPETRTYEGEVPDKYGVWPTEDFETGGVSPLIPPLLRARYFLKHAGTTATDSLLILHKGKLVYENYAAGCDKDTPHFLASASKSVLSALVGIAIGEGKIKGVDDKVVDYFPEARKLPGWQESKADMTVEHLLTMTSGLPGDGDRADLEWWDASASPGEANDTGLASFLAPQQAKPGERYAYSTGAGCQALACLVSRAVGKNLFAYAKEKLFGPLGMASVTWDAPADGRNYGGMGVRMTPRDMLRFGYLYLNNGRWEDKQIFPAWWAAQSGPRGKNPLAYGRLFMNCGIFPFSSSFEAAGAMGQYICILPEQDMVVVRTGSAGPIVRTLAGTEGATLELLLGLAPLKNLPVDYLKYKIFLARPGD